MTIDEAIAKHRKIAETQKTLYDACTLKERNKHFLREAEEHEQLANWLEELKDYQDKNKMVVRVDVENMDSIKDKIEELSKYAERQYNKALNDFVNACEKQFTTMYGQRYVDMRDIEEMAEQLKAGGNS